MTLASNPPLTAPRKPRPRPSTDFAELSRRVQGAGLLERRRGYYWVRIVTLTLAFVGVWVGFGLLGNSWFQLLIAAGLGVVVTQFSFLGHDGAHRQIFASSAWNEWTARVFAGVFVGVSYGWWATKHNRHHSAPNQEGRDPDIASGVLAFTPALASRRSGWRAWLTKHQGWAFFPLLLLEGLHLHFASIETLARRAGTKHRHLEQALILIRLSSYVLVLFLFLPFGKAAAFFGLQMGLFGVLLGGSFAPNHKGMPIVPPTAKVDFLRRQVLMSRNIEGGPLTDFAMGGLNYQIEHHLFPNMPRPNLRRAQPLVRSFCEERGVAYTQTTLLQSYGIVVRYLNAVGLGARDPFTCPLITQYRG